MRVSLSLRRTMWKLDPLCPASSRKVFGAALPALEAFEYMPAFISTSTFFHISNSSTRSHHCALEKLREQGRGVSPLATERTPMRARPFFASRATDQGKHNHGIVEASDFLDLTAREHTQYHDDCGEQDEDPDDGKQSLLVLRLLHHGEDRRRLVHAVGEWQDCSLLRTSKGEDDGTPIREGRNGGAA